MQRLFSFLVLIAALWDGQNFSDYRTRYDNYEENDARAFQYLTPYIAKAKKERNFPELSQAYKDAVSFSRDDKIAFADSMIEAAAHTADKDLLATAFLTKGTVYYFNYRKFKPALDEYLKAWKLTQHSGNAYLHYKNLYHIGVVKSYLGYYAEALEIFKKCDQFFSIATVSPEPPNIHYNRRKGYLNTLHQLGRCYLQMSKWKEAEEIVDRGLVQSGVGADFYVERSYFYLLKGILAFHQKNDGGAIFSLNTALAGLEKKTDFTNASLAYYYKGKSEARLNHEAAAVKNFVKIDSVFRLYQFILPEVRGSYEFLINRYRREQDQELELYYTTQLLKADRIISEDFKYLSTKIYKEYDTKHLLAAKQRLERSVSVLVVSVILGTAVLGVLLTLIYIKYKRRLRKENMKPDDDAEYKVLKEVSQDSTTKRGQKVPDAVAEAVLAKLVIMEKNNFFLQKHVTLHLLAPQLQTNSSYLSIIIKEHRGCHFRAYLRQMRIQYVTKKLREEKRWRHYSVETLASECGFKDRQHFSKAFETYNKMTPVAFIRHLEEAAAEGDVTL